MFGYSALIIYRPRRFINHLLTYLLTYLLTDISATVTSIAVKLCMMVHIGPGHKVDPLGAVPKGIPKIQNFGPQKSEYLKNDNSQRSTSITA